MGIWKKLTQPLTDPKSIKPYQMLMSPDMIQSEIAWKYYKDKLEERSKANVPPEYPWAAPLAQRLGTGREGSTWALAADRAEASLRRAGMNPAAAAAAAARVGSAARLEAAKVGEGFWTALTRTRKGLESQADGIKTTSADVAYLMGYTQGGGVGGAGNLATSGNR